MPVKGSYGTTKGYGGSLSQMEQETTAKIEAREKETRALYDQIISMYQPGGGFGAGTEAMIEAQKRRDVASATQSLVSSGLYGTSNTAGLATGWEATVGMPARLKLEDIRYGALTEALGAKAKFVENIQNLYPDYNLLAQLTAQASSASVTPDYGGIGPSWFEEASRKLASGQSLLR